jgi:hypothetical protein
MAVIDWHWQAEALSLTGHCGGGAVFGEGGKAEPQRCNSEANCEKGAVSMLYRHYMR